MDKEQRLIMLVGLLGDSSARHVGGVGGGYTEEGQWAARCIASEFGAEALGILCKKAMACLALPVNNLDVLRQFGLEDSEAAMEWQYKVNEHFNEYTLSPDCRLTGKDLKQHVTSQDLSKRESGAAFIAVTDSWVRVVGIPILFDLLEDEVKSVRDVALKALTFKRGKPFIFGNKKPVKWKKWWKRASKHTAIPYKG